MLRVWREKVDGAEMTVKVRPKVKNKPFKETARIVEYQALRFEMERLSDEMDILWSAMTLKEQDYLDAL